MDENDVVNVLEAVFGGDPDAAYDIAESLQSIQTFASAEVMTNDKGLVIRFDDGREFQITVIRSR